MKVYLIHNPVAGQHDHTAELDEVVAYLGQQGWDVTIKRTQDESDATAFAREAVDNHCDMAIAVGGDGTLGQVASGLAKSDVTLGLIPVGTGNVWARLFNIPIWTPTNRSGLMDAAKLLIDGKVKRIDLGRVRDRYFVLYAGLGIDAALANQVEPHRELRRNLGNVTYVVAAASMSLQMRGTRATIVIDGQVTRQRVLLVRQPGGNVAVTIDELFGQRSFLEEQLSSHEALAEGRYSGFIDRAYKVGGHAWGVFSLDRLSRTPEFRQAAA